MARSAALKIGEVSATIPFGFSSFILLDAVESSLNPLGLSTAHTRLAREVFPQMTVLTQQPRNHAILCGFAVALEIAGEAITAQNIRRAEILWGLGQAIRRSNGEGITPLNIRRYNSVLSDLSESNKVSLVDCEKAKYRMMDRLGYGVWGYYVRPSEVWNLFDTTNRKLLPLGRELGIAFNNETGFGEICSRWLNKKSILLDDKFMNVAELSGLDAEPGGEELKAWRKINTDFRLPWRRSAKKQIDEVWDILPAPKELFKMCDQNAYPSFFKSLLRKAKNSMLSPILITQSNFEEATAWIEFAFELLYLEPGSPQKMPETAWKEIFDNAHAAVLKYKAERQTFAVIPDVFRRIEECTDSKRFRTAILSEHGEIQKQKSKGAYIDTSGRVLTVDAMNCNRARRVLESFDGRIDHDLVRFEFRREWHYLKASIYKDSIK